MRIRLVTVALMHSIDVAVSFRLVGFSPLRVYDAFLFVQIQEGPEITNGLLLSVRCVLVPLDTILDSLHTASASVTFLAVLCLVLADRAVADKTPRMQLSSALFPSLMTLLGRPIEPLSNVVDEDLFPLRDECDCVDRNAL